MLFKPICDQILRHRDPKDVGTLHDMVQATDSYYLQNIQQFLLIPLLSQLKVTDSGPARDKSDIQVKMVEVVKLVLEKTEIRQVTALKTILIILSKEVYEFQTGQLIQVSEELRIAILTCIEVANRRASSDCVEELFQPENSLIVCQTMYVILSLLDSVDYREIKMRAIDALMALLQVDDSADFNDIVLRNQISGIIFFAVPMIWKSLSTVILNDPKIGRRVIERALIALGRVVCLIMEDDRSVDRLEPDLNIIHFKALLQSNMENIDSGDSILHGKDKKRSPEWLKAAGRKLRDSFQTLTTLTGNESAGIRKELGICCELWIRNCKISLEDNLITFAEILLILSEDEDVSISKYFTNVIQEIQRQRPNKFTVANRDLIERHLGRISRIIFRQSEKEQLTALALLKAQLNHLPDRELVLLFSSRKMLEVFTQVLLLFVEFNHENPDLLKEEYTIRRYDEAESQSVVLRPWEDYKHFNSKSPKVISLIKEIMKSLGGRSATRILIEYLLDLIRDRPLNIAEIVKILQLIAASGFEKENFEIVETLLEELLDDRYWNLSYQVVKNSRGVRSEHLRVSEHTEGLYESSLLVKYVDTEQDDPEEYLISPQEAKVNVLVSCVLMEMVSSLASRLESEHFQKYLFRILYNLLANAGNSNLCIHSAGVLALAEIRKVYNCTGIRELIMQNSDYVMFFINQSLRHPDRSKSALDVISVILEYCSKDVIGYVELIVHRLLDECSKYHKMDNLSAYLKIFGLFLKNLKTEDQDAEIPTEKNADEILSQWLAIRNPEPTDDDIEIGDPRIEEAAMEESVPEEAPSVKKVLPKEVEICKEIMQVALKHISSKKLSEVLAAMETLTWGVAVLRSHPDELLPIVHQIWTPLAKRFSDDSPVVLRNAFQLLLTLADSAKDFIHRRTVDEVVPALNQILITNVSLVGRGQEAGSRFTQQFKLVLEILSNYHIVILRLNIHQKHLDDILSAIALYYPNTRPKLLSTAARNCFSALKCYDGAVAVQKLLACNHLLTINDAF